MKKKIVMPDTLHSYCRARSRAGFTLLELMVVAGILVVAITALLSTFISAFLLNQANTNKMIAANDAQYVLEKLKRVDYVNVTSYTDANFTDLHLANESIAVTVTTGTNDKTVVANVTWIEQRRQRAFNLTTQISP